MAKVHKVTPKTHSKSPKMTMSQWENSPMDRAMDKKMGYKEGSKADNRADRKALTAYNKRRK